MKVTKEMFILIGKCDQEYFRQNASKVIDKEISLKCLLEGVKKVMETNKTLKLVTTLTKYQSHQELQEKFPDKFSQEKLEMFVGAKVENKNSNQKGQLLKKYCSSVLENKQIEPVKFEYIEMLRDVRKEVFEQADVIVLNLSKFEIGTSSDVIEIVVNTSKPYHVLLLLFENYQAHNEAQTFVSSLSLPEGVVARPVLFQVGKPKVAKGFIDNAVYGLILGRVHIFGASVKVINGCVEETLKEFIAAISPLPASAVVVTEAGLSIIPIHSYDQEDFEVCYFSNKISTERFLKSKDHPQSETVNLEFNSQGATETITQESSNTENMETCTPTDTESENLLEPKYKSVPEKSTEEFSSSEYSSFGSMSGSSKQFISSYSKELEKISEDINTDTHY